MIKRLKTGMVTVAGLCALALGGAAIAGAATSGHPAAATPAAQTAAATGTAATSTGTTTTADREDVKDAADPGGEHDRTERETTDPVSETAGESAAGGDGPGGHADEPANPNANTQQAGGN